MKRLFNKLLDKSIYYSFDNTGFSRHQKEYFSDYQKTDLGRVLITGGTAGIGQSLSRLIEKNAEVLVTGRNKSNFNPYESLEFLELDSGDWSGISEFAKNSPKINNLVLNAGAMPDKRLVNNYGIESQCASQLLGHLHLFKELHKREKLARGAHVIITSSGGMLLKKLDLPSLFLNKKYEKVSTYANVKRAQIILVEFLANKYPEYTFSSMHPGWVDTKAVRVSLPGFYSFMGDRLRTPSQGADTIEFLLHHKVESGRFWFDRKESPTHLTPLTRGKVVDIRKLTNCFEDFLACPADQLEGLEWLN
jgi:dehydrogenase/reductase SDR family protein 12